MPVEYEPGLVSLLVGAVGVFLLGGIVGFYTSNKIVASRNSPKRVVSARKDLNGDRIDDIIVIKNNGEEIKMLSVPQGRIWMFVPEKEYEKFSSDALTPRDYDRTYQELTK